jgi:hypothetical protein
MTEKLKICMIGATAVGKTSLVGRFVSSVFRDSYITTIGVKIQSRRVVQDGRELNLILWDLSGEDEFYSVQPAYLRGAAGYLVVMDGTRRETLETAIALQARARGATGNQPFVGVLNKSDLAGSWELDAQVVADLRGRGWPVVATSAKTGSGVAEAFERLVAAILERRRKPWR